MMISSVITGSPDPVRADTLGPAEKVEALQAQADQHYPFVVRFVDDVNEAGPARGFDLSDPKVTRLELINGIAVTLQVAEAFKLAKEPGIAQVWYLHPELAPLYTRVIEALDYNVRTLPLPNLVNLSLGPPSKFWSPEFHPEEPIHAATYAAAEAGLVPVMAIGNNSKAADMPGWINPWCRPEWVICVGAYDVRQDRIAEFSARGAKAHPDTWPDVVADGVDVISTYPSGKKKSSKRKAQDEADPRFRKLVPKEKWDIYTMESGTSQAAAHVSSAAGQILFFLRSMIDEKPDFAAGGALFEITVPADRSSFLDSGKPRLTGSVKPQKDGSTVLEYHVDLPWKMIKQLVVDTALPVAKAEPHEVGAGLVDLAYVQEQFGQFGLAETKLFLSKVTER